MPAPVFQNSVVIITGASMGIGRALALQLARQGAKLVLASRSPEKLSMAVEACREQTPGADVVAVPTDVADPAQCQALVQQAVEQFGQIDMLVNNAGVSMWARFDKVQDLSLFEKMLRTNYLGSLYCTFYALPYLQQTRGRIVGVGSLASKAGVPYRSGYAASKHAMTGFFDSLRIELEGTGVSVTMVYPGFVATGGQGRGFGPDGKPIGTAPVNMEKMMSAEECAANILRAAEKRKREEVMTLRGKLGQWIKLIAPRLVDRIARKAIEAGH